MKRRAGLIATVTAFFVLQMPLCALACVEAPAPDATAAQHSCHDEGSGSPPVEAPVSHEGCGCALAPEAFASQASDSNLTQVDLEMAPALCPERNIVAATCAPSTVFNVDLPPPDILLQKSTLLL
ncbi:MAG: hypothetical protein GY910_18735 [bacterium]|nr:hypothetical protein [Deltaproteobacteria bacterium]MCP4907016.1 hypothetical protein [bacterium]